MDKLARFVIETVGHRMGQAAILDVWLWAIFCWGAAALFVGSFLKALWGELRREWRGF